MEVTVSRERRLFNIVGNGVVRIMRHSKTTRENLRASNKTEAEKFAGQVLFRYRHPNGSQKTDC